MENPRTTPDGARRAAAGGSQLGLRLGAGQLSVSSKESRQNSWHLSSTRSPASCPANSIICTSELGRGTGVTVTSQGLLYALPGCAKLGARKACEGFRQQGAKGTIYPGLLPSSCVQLLTAAPAAGQQPCLADEL